MSPGTPLCSTWHPSGRRWPFSRMPSSHREGHQGRPFQCLTISSSWNGQEQLSDLSSQALSAAGFVCRLLRQIFREAAYLLMHAVIWPSLTFIYGRKLTGWDELCRRSRLPPDPRTARPQRPPAVFTTIVPGRAPACISRPSVLPSHVIRGGWIATISYKGIPAAPIIACRAQAPTHC